MNNSHPKAEKAGRRPGAMLVFVILLVTVVIAGCASIPALPPADLSTPGWIVKRGQAVWKFGRKAPEIVGDLLVAARSDGQLFAQFSKTPLTLAEARYDGAVWELNLPMYQRRIAGRGEPGKRFGLFQLARELAGQTPPAPWEIRHGADGHWRLANPRSGESIEGYWER